MQTALKDDQALIEECRKVAEIASSWWADNLDLCYAEEDQREDFKEILFKGIFLEITKNPYSTITLSSDEIGTKTGIFLMARKFAQIRENSFPPYVEMKVSINEIVIGGKCPQVFEPKDVIYRA